MLSSGPPGVYPTIHAAIDPQIPTMISRVSS
jgi:hypothetical protein